MRSTAFFDLDRTLLDCNSARLWMAFEWRNGRISLGDVMRASWYLVRYSLGQEGGAEHFYVSAVRRLDGLEEAVLDERTAEWWASMVVHRLRPGARDAIERHRTAGDRLVLATSSSTYAARMAVESFGLDAAICTRFEVVDGRFTGEIAEFAFGDHKRDRVREWADAHDVALADATFYSDSYTDLAAMAACGTPVAVNPDRRLAAHAKSEGWSAVDWGASSAA